MVSYCRFRIEIIVAWDTGNRAEIEQGVMQL